MALFLPAKSNATSEFIKLVRSRLARRIFRLKQNIANRYAKKLEEKIGELEQIYLEKISELTRLKTRIEAELENFLHEKSLQIANMALLRFLEKLDPNTKEAIFTSKLNDLKNMVSGILSEKEINIAKRILLKDIESVVAFKRNGIIFRYSVLSDLNRCTTVENHGV